MKIVKSMLSQAVNLIVFCLFTLVLCSCKEEPPMRPAVTEVIAHPDQAKSIASIMDDYQYKQTKLNKLPLKSGEEQEVVDASPRARNPDLWQDHLRYLEQIKTKSSKGSAKAAELKPPKFEVSQ